MGELVKIAETKDLPAGSAIQVEVRERKLAVFNVAGSYYAIDDTCTHQAGPLSEGEVEGTTVTCPWHGATFDVTTGNVLGPPDPSGVRSYRVQVDGGDIKVEVP